MGVPTSEVGYTSATAGREDHEVHKGHVVAFGKKTYDNSCIFTANFLIMSISHVEDTV
jgi:hypothetical protein